MIVQEGGISNYGFFGGDLAPGDEARVVGSSLKIFNHGSYFAEATKDRMHGIHGILVL